MITLRQLRYLVALAEARHYGQAAAACHVTQPALSMQIQEMEAALGTQLVERRRGGVELTETGRDVVRRARRILAEVRDLEDFARHRRKLLSGALRLGVIPSIAPYLLPLALPAIQASYPELELQLRETQTQILLTELKRGTLDVLLLALPVADRELESIRLFDDRFLIARGTAGHSPTGRVDPNALADEKLLLLEEGHCLRDQALAYCGNSMRMGPLAGFGASSLATIIQMVANGYGITILPEIAAKAEVTDGRIELLRFTDPEPSRAVGLAWRRSSPRKRDFVELGRVLTECRPRD
ncbi:LysR substrate-binding domain-containing protein [Geminicoccus roseus]|uniref:LysR substrate-binding domain-containing protein n=1 Tax=Geminicoccus roseus TaxID=404900 RepID=UPI00040A25CF|nr:LysR substrate-binding domain-containing protein [Geminicoccus roseus]